MLVLIPMVILIMMAIFDPFKDSIYSVLDTANATNESVCTSSCSGVYTLGNSPVVDAGLTFWNISPEGPHQSGACSATDPYSICYVLDYEEGKVNVTLTNTSEAVNVSYQYRTGEAVSTIKGVNTQTMNAFDLGAIIPIIVIGVFLIGLLATGFVFRRG